MTDVPTPLLCVERVSKRFETPGAGPTVTVLREASLTLDSGDSLAILGPSGSGKSTLLNLIGALDRPTGGSVRLQSRDYAALSDIELAHLRNRQIGLVFQLHHLLPQCTALENVLVPTLAESRRTTPEIETRARQLLERVGLGERLHFWPSQLSGGERQRVAVVRALINAPLLLLADEPTGALDQESAAALADLLVDLNRTDGLTLIVVTHSPDLARRMKRVCALRGGVLEETTPARNGGA